MEKRIEDYLHLYYMGECMEAIIVPGQDLIWNKGVISVRTIFNIEGKLSEVKPILRRLTDLTDEHYAFMGLNFTLWDHDRKLAKAEKEALKLNYLLKEGFDLFGLIEAGLAIDRSSITPK
jgi:hypothetical protein